MYILNNMSLSNHHTFNVLCESVDWKTKQECSVLMSDLCTYSGSMDYMYIHYQKDYNLVKCSESA